MKGIRLWLKPLGLAALVIVGALAIMATGGGDGGSDSAGEVDQLVIYATAITDSNNPFVAASLDSGQSGIRGCCG